MLGSLIVFRRKRITPHPTKSPLVHLHRTAPLLPPSSPACGRKLLAMRIIVPKSVIFFQVTEEGGKTCDGGTKMSTYNWGLGVFVSGTLVSFQKEGRRQKERKQLALELSSRDEIACNSGTALFVASLQYWCLKFSGSWVMF